MPLFNEETGLELKGKLVIIGGLTRRNQGMLWRPGSAAQSKNDCCGACMQPKNP